MKSYFVVLFALIIILLSAQISNPIMINGDEPHKMTSGQRAYQIVDNAVYLTYRYQYGYIYFTRLSATNYQTHTVVDTLSDWFNRFTDPAIQVMDNGNIIIVYSEIENSDLGYLRIATSTDNGASFSVEDIEISEFGDPHIVKNNNGLDICYSNNLQEKSLAEFQHFTEYEKSENEDGGYASGFVKFFGMDEYFGHVHSNDDIWIYNAGGWPIFHGLVTTAGRIMDFTTMAPAEDSAPMEEIFIGGYEEEVEPYEQIGLEELHDNSYWIGEDKEIVYVKLGNGSFDVKYADITSHVDTLGVYSWYPHNAVEANAVVNAGGNWYDDADQIWSNYVTVYDTIWTPGSGFANQNQSVFISDAELWIEGQVYGKQTWGCAENIYIVGDITYENTPPGSPPDNPVGMNTTDYFGLVSEKRIYLRYKHKDPFNDMVLRDDNCTDVMLYGAYAALGVGDTLVYGDLACHYDGIFSFEYQHPHGSTPDFTALSPYTLQETLYTYLDLHKYIFPQTDMLPPQIEGFNLHGGNPVMNSTCGFPYESVAYIDSYPNNNSSNYANPYGTDHPWYNPVWPESSDDIVFERGTITMFGSLAQTRRGFIHRSGSDPYNHVDNEWDLDEFHYDGVHGSTGYDKDYHNDSRFISVQPPNFPRAIQAPDASRNINVLHSSDGQNFTESHLEELDDPIISLWMDSDGESVLIAYQTASDLSQIHFLISISDPLVYAQYSVDSEGSLLKNAHINGNNIYVLCENGIYDVIYRYQIGNPIPELIESFDTALHFNDFTVGESGALAYVHEQYFSSNYLNLNYRFDNLDGTLVGLESWNYPFNDISYFDSEISIKLDENNTVHSSILLDQFTNNYPEGDLYLISGELEGIVEILEDNIITPNVSMNIYPNPFNPETIISFSTKAENSQNVEINVYNVKGQKVRSFSSLSHPELIEGSVVWNGRDMNDRAVSTGVYLFELRSKNSTLKTKKGLLLK